MAGREPKTVFHPISFSKGIEALFNSTKETKLACIARRDYVKSRPKTEIYPEHLLLSPWATRQGLPGKLLFREIKKTLGDAAYMYLLHQLDMSESLFIELDYTSRCISIQPMPFGKNFIKTRNYFSETLANSELTYVLKKIRGSWVCITGPAPGPKSPETVLSHYHNFELYAISHAYYLCNESDSCTVVASVMDDSVTWRTQHAEKDPQRWP